MTTIAVLDLDGFSHLTQIKESIVTNGDSYRTGAGRPSRIRC